MVVAVKARLGVLHALRLRGFGEVDRIAEVLGDSSAEVAPVLAGLAAADRALVTYRPGPVLGGWTLTAEGRAEGARLLAEELIRCGMRAEVAAVYEEFRALNRSFLCLCTRWQLRDRTTINDHSDSDYDAGVIEELVSIDARTRPLVEVLSATLPRFGHYRTRFDVARSRVEAGDRDWFAKAMIDSYHTVWFELHEDLLATLGLERATESDSS